MLTISSTILDLKKKIAKNWSETSFLLILDDDEVVVQDEDNKLDPDLLNLAVADAKTCSLCSATFTDKFEMRQHFKVQLLSLAVQNTKILCQGIWFKTSVTT